MQLRSPGIAWRAKELAAPLGCVYKLCVDYDSYDDDTVYYAWWVLMPAAEHVRGPARYAVAVVLGLAGGRAVDGVTAAWAPAPGRVAQLRAG